jgi:NADPH-dependent 2,4-dienoyl-CoA reductase/sulfur reductase-like enzyme
MMLLPKRALFLASAGAAGTTFFHLLDSHGAESQSNNVTSCGNITQSPTYVGTYSVAIIGGGVVGLAIASALAEAHKDLRIVVLEKEDSIAAGASSGELM